MPIVVEAVPARRNIARLALIATNFVLVAGCGKQAEIQTYTVAKETPVHELTNAGVARGDQEPTHRMLAAIVPMGTQAWFFKAVGTIDEMETLAETVEEFFADLRVDSEQGRVVWKLPEAWQQEAGNQMRFATLKVPTDDGELEMSITELPWTGSGMAGLTGNVNRWRRQMQLPAIGPDRLGDCTRELDLDGHPATIVDLLGTYQSSGMTAPFAASAARQPPATPAQVPSGAAAASIAPDAPKMDVPESWQPGRLNMFRKAAFVVADGEQNAEITVTNFSAAVAAMADPLANVNRWRGEVGLGPIDADELESTTEAIEIDGLPATYVALLPEGSDRGTLAAMVRRDEIMWFFKMHGHRELVDRQREDFRQFVQSVRFESGE